MSAKLDHVNQHLSVKERAAVDTSNLWTVRNATFLEKNTNQLHRQTLSPQIEVLVHAPWPKYFMEKNVKGQKAVQHTEG